MKEKKLITKSRCKARKNLIKSISMEDINREAKNIKSNLQTKYETLKKRSREYLPNRRHSTETMDMNSEKPIINSEETTQAPQNDSEPESGERVKLIVQPITPILKHKREASVHFSK